MARNRRNSHTLNEFHAHRVRTSQPPTAALPDRHSPVRSLPMYSPRSNTRPRHSPHNLRRQTNASNVPHRLVDANCLKAHAKQKSRARAKRRDGAEWRNGALDQQLKSARNGSKLAAVPSLQISERNASSAHALDNLFIHFSCPIKATKTASPIVSRAALILRADTEALLNPLNPDLPRAMPPPPSAPPGSFYASALQPFTL